MAIRSCYSVNGRQIAERDGNGVRLDYIPDAKGSVVASVKTDTTVSHTARYRPYGGDLAVSGTQRPRFGWIGSVGYFRTERPYVDYYVRARTYSSSLGTWCTLSPLWPVETAYGYARSSPTTFVDPSGLFFDPQVLLQDIPEPLKNMSPHEIQQFQDAVKVAMPAVAALGARATGVMMAQAAIAAVRPMLSKSPHVMAAFIGWSIGTYIDKNLGVSDYWLERFFPGWSPEVDELAADYDFISKLYRAKVQSADYRKIPDYVSTLARRTAINDYRDFELGRRSTKSRCCTNAEIDRIHDAYKWLEDITPKCDEKRHNCRKLAGIILSNAAIARLRLELMNKCFGGGDKDHVDEYNRVIQRMRKCHTAGSGNYHGGTKITKGRYATRRCWPSKQNWDFVSPMGGGGSGTSW